jgi:UDP-N-acetylglucosamine 4,6-dehydratase
MDFFDGRSVLVTGGTGSFGKTFVERLVRRNKAKRIVVFSRDELKQFEMQQQIDASIVRYFLGDVRDRERLERAFQDIDTVVHAAAMKQVVAAEYNPIECILTNVIGAENIVNAAINCGVERVIALSTDKAVNPINLYGASKLCSDKLFIAANHLAGGKSKFSVVRYGNVVGSRGSVIPFFQQRRKMGRLPITDPRMTRFWITLEQGCAFVEKATEMMQGGEVFVPKIPSMRITDLAKAIAPECEHEIVGIRPGEKLHECLIPADEVRSTLEFDDFYVIRPSYQLWKQANSSSYGGREGREVVEPFAYTSDSNPEWLTEAELREIAS